MIEILAIIYCSSLALSSLLLLWNLHSLQSRRKKYIFESALVKSSNLSRQQIKEILEQFKSQF